ncbi:OmpP1/FadL family transporter [Roseovarius sp. D22-M7]|uniref:OmpP1/FadL family transporter n=1 Tax=Roseovarius sp. D22-M7 TaxID=3127116 RepID=UPI00300F96AB
MKHLILAATVLGTASSGAIAGGIERRGDPSQILFEEGRRYLEFSVSSVQPDVSGGARPIGPPASLAGPTGDIQETYQNYAIGYKNQINDRLAIAFVIDEPVGADVDYRTASFFSGGAFFGGSQASVSSIRFTGMAKYNATERFSVYGGLQYVGLSGDLTVLSPATGGLPPADVPPGPGTLGRYNLSVDTEYDLGYLLGAAYEIPDIALRVALTYESKTEHDFRDNTGAPFTVELPQSVTLHAQSGIAADTLLFGSIRWREWTEFEVAPGDFFSFASGAPVTTPIAFNRSDVYTYRLGLGRSFTDTWSGAFILGYEEQTGDQKGNLDGTDGFTSYTLALTHGVEAWEVTGALSYVDFGNADTSVASFRGNDAVAFGLKVGFRF